MIENEQVAAAAAEVKDEVAAMRERHRLAEEAAKIDPADEMRRKLFLFAFGMTPEQMVRRYRDARWADNERMNRVLALRIGWARATDKARFVKEHAILWSRR